MVHDFVVFIVVVCFSIASCGPCSCDLNYYTFVVCWVFSKLSLDEATNGWSGLVSGNERPVGPHDVDTPRAKFNGCQEFLLLQQQRTAIKTYSRCQGTNYNTSKTDKPHEAASAFIHPCWINCLHSFYT